MQGLKTLAALLGGLLIAFPVLAADPPDNLPKERTVGPAHVAVRDQANIDLPSGYVFFPEKSAKELMQKMGNQVDNSLVGLIAPQRGGDWFVLVEYQPTGHISDEDAKDWEADALLDQIRKNTDIGNEERRKAGIGELEIVGWAEKPIYDKATQRLIWSVAAKTKGADDASNIVNYKTLMLGREGLVSMTMVSPLATIATEKSYVTLLLSKLDYTAGRKYGDFNAKTDHIAEYGLAALIAGVAVKKLGLIALGLAFALKFAKIIGIAVIGGLAGFRRFFRRKKSPPAEALPAPSASQLPPPQSPIVETLP
jgi:uncharacterized membrane-anchored protein